MNDIQKAIDEAESSEGSGVYVFDYYELKSLLGQVAKEQRDKAVFRYSLLSVRSHEAVTEALENTSLVTENLIFNED